MEPLVCRGMGKGRGGAGLFPSRRNRALFISFPLLLTTLLLQGGDLRNALLFRLRDFEPAQTH